MSDRKEWTILKHKGKDRGFAGLQWTNVIAKGVRTIHPFCSVAFLRHRLRVVGSNKCPEFMCKGYCQFKDCPITFTVTVKSADDLKAKVEFEVGAVFIIKRS